MKRLTNPLAKKDRHNFHVSPVIGWEYFGDVNIEQGGIFLNTEDLNEVDSSGGDYVRLLSVYEVNAYDCVYALLQGYVLIDADRLSMAEKLCAANGVDFTAFNSALEIEQYYGAEVDSVEYVRIGNSNEMQQGWGGYPEPDKILKHNARLANYVRRCLKGM